MTDLSLKNRKKGKISTYNSLLSLHFTQLIFLINILNEFNLFFFYSTFKYKLCKDSFLKHIIAFSRVGPKDMDSMEQSKWKA